MKPQILRLIDLAHRWIGGTIGAFLAILGLSGALLVHRDSWIGLPQEPGRQSVERTGILAETLLSDPGKRPQRIQFAGEDFGLTRVTWPQGNGAYVDWSGAVVDQWKTVWDRPELWLAELHHHFFAGGPGQAVVGVIGCLTITLALMGLVLWWRTRKSFAFRLWPKKMTRPAILKHHRDMGAVVVPLLLLSSLTGTLLVFRPLTSLIFGPGAYAAIEETLKQPSVSKDPPALRLEWRGLIQSASMRFPDAELRSIEMPSRPGAPITIQLRRPFEWLRNGRTAVWISPVTGRVIATRDAASLPWQAKAFNTIYPLHSGSAGGPIHRILMTMSGLALALFGGLTVWTYWFRRPRKPTKGKYRIGADDG